MENSYKEFAESIFGTCIYKLNIIRLKGDDYLNDFCSKIEAYLEEEKNAIVDRADLIAFRSLGANILQLLGLLVSTQNPSSRWVEPLLLEFYSKIGIDINNRLILTAQSPEKIHQETSEGFAVYVDILSTFRDILPDDISRKKLDIFVVPTEAQFDLVSLAIFGHEIGHVLWKESYQSFKGIIINKYKTYIKKGKTDITLFDFQEEQERFLSHIQEYFCDEIGRKIFGIVFDLAVLKILCLRSSGDFGESKTHPPSIFRIFTSFRNLEAFQSVEKNIQVKEYISDFLKDFKEWDREVKYDKKEAVIDTTKALFSIPGIEKLPLCRETIDIGSIWKRIKRELDAFRPPVEVVSLEAPDIFKPTEIVIGIILYYYNGKYYEKNNEYFLNSNEDRDVRTLTIKRILKDHLMYAISLYEFCKRSRELFEFDRKELESTLWRMRTRKVGEQKASLTIIPSIYPKVQYGNNSVDLRLGSYFLIHRPSKYIHISPYPGKAVTIDDFYEEVYVPPTGEFILHPHQFILATSLEYLSLPYDFYGLILGRSSWGRLGLNIATATTVQAGYRGCITLELRNLGETPLPLKVGVRIAQLCLIKLHELPEVLGYFAAKDNKYIGPIKAEPPKIKKDVDWQLLS